MPRPLLVNIPRRLRGHGGMTVEAGAAKGTGVVTLPARPEPIRVSVDETAIVVIDMQNAYASPGGYVDLAGFDIAGAAGTIGQIAKVLETARAAGMHGRLSPERLGRGLCRGGRAGLAQLAQVQRAEDDARAARAAGQVARPRRLGLRAGRRAGAAAGRHRPAQDPLSAPSSTRSSIPRCARAASATSSSSASPPTSASRSTLRDGFHLEYFGVMLEDATHHLGPDFIQAASVYNVEKFFGWVSHRRRFLRQPSASIAEDEVEQE